MKKISFLLCLSMTFNNLAIEQASAKEANSYETCFVYENMDENKVNLEEIARELFADPLCTTLNKKVGKRKIKSCKSEELRNLATALYNKQYDTQFRVNSFKPVTVRKHWENCCISETVTAPTSILQVSYSSPENTSSLSTV